MCYFHSSILVYLHIDQLTAFVNKFCLHNPFKLLTMAIGKKVI